MVELKQHKKETPFTKKKKKTTLAGKMQKQYCQKHRGRKQRECKQDRKEEQEDEGAISSLIAPHGG